MTVKIKNDILTAEIDLYGGKLISLAAQDGTEYIWRDTSSYWPDRACLLFPTSGRLYGGMYTHKGRSYRMPLHGFAYTSEFAVSEIGVSSVTLSLKDNSHTLETYPFRFDFSVKYELSGNTLHTVFSVKNTGEETMFFALGFHPWFNVPTDKKLSFSDCRAEFPDAEEINICRMSENVLDSGKRIPLGGKIINLNPSLFSDDVIILEGTGGKLHIDCGQRGGITVGYEGMPYLGLWNTAKKDVRFLCAEPMTSLPGREGITEELSGRRDIVSLEAGKTYETEVTVTADASENRGVS